MRIGLRIGNITQIAARSHADLQNLGVDDHTQYFLADCSRSLTGVSLHREVLDTYLQVQGSLVGAGYGANLLLYGANHLISPGIFRLRVPNAAKNADVLVLEIVGVSDNPEISLVTRKVINPNVITRELFLPAYGHTTGVSGAVDKYHAMFLADAANLACFMNMKVPEDVIAFVSAKAVWESVAAAGNMRWQLEASYAAAGEARDTHLDSPALGVTATGGVEVLNVQEPANPLTLAQLALGDYIGFEFRRTGDHIDDTLGQTVHLLGLLITYTAYQITPGV